MASRSKRLVLALLIVVAVGAAAGLYYGFKLKAGNATDTLVLYGNIDIREADLAFNNAGRVETVVVEEGDTVEQGQLLATLDDNRFSAEVAAARAKIGAQQAVLDRLLAGSRPEEIAKARADANAIEASLQDAQSKLKRTESLAKQDFASRQTLDSDRSRVNALDAQLKASQKALELVVLGPRKEDIAEAQATLQALQAELTLAEEKLRDSKLYAKESGTVKTRIVEPGAVVLAQTPIYTIALSDPLWVRTYVSEIDLGHIRPGMKGEVFTDSAPNVAHEGWIGFISPVAEFTPKSVETPEVRTSLVYRVRLYVKNPGNTLRQGMPVTVRMKTGGDDDGATKSTGR
jgi:membrane fusion protein YbhG